VTTTLERVATLKHGARHPPEWLRGNNHPGKGGYIEASLISFHLRSFNVTTTLERVATLKPRPG
ncbi:MAG: hypothetical protein JAZ11_09880, partial [Candidatus Thiodiazotropha lotti]|nr:hypothetical protein [Candidatus Thiodiazotropha lotti]